jgi:large subunit ribosomal protein L4
MAKAPTAPKVGGGTVKLEPEVFEAAFNEPLVHESVRAELNARRRGTAATKTRGEVRGGGAKPWRQKGTGRARAGSNRSPIWTGGGITFGPSPRAYTFKVNRKARRAALRSALSVHASRGSLGVLDAGAFDAPATKTAAEALKNWAPTAQSAPTLLVLAAGEDAAAKSFRNIKRTMVLDAEAVGIADIIRAAALVVSDAALEALTARAKGDTQPQAAGTGKTESAAEVAA